MKKIILATVMMFTTFTSFAQFGQILPGAGYQAILYNPYLGQTLDIRTNTLDECIDQVRIEMVNNASYVLLSSCRANIFNI